MSNKQMIFWGPELLKVAALGVLDMADGRLYRVADRRLTFRSTPSVAVATAEGVTDDNPQPLIVKEFTVTAEQVREIETLLPEFDVIDVMGMLELQAHVTDEHHEMKQSYIADFKETFESEIGHRDFAAYLRDATYRYAD
ncbi:hypothetical protein C6P08_05075 [Weissella confusa]|uniref:Uncharacterized protein n=2 Tax=Weissella confusa TaxID=1583 RepID=A0AAJ2YZC4_WEICO|nr:hypothetical protein [Weissella confusa]MBJ7695520.1 hypothetical protein [Weissella confusa]NBA12517.1 hypothetical protein [Weissella confusa]QBZ04590.1 hypothetical protein C6P08_05075 [Weissella confusa]